MVSARSSLGEPDEPHPRPREDGAEHVQPVQDAPVDDQVLTRRPDRRPPGAGDRQTLPILAAFLSDQSTEVAVRPLIAPGAGLREQPQRADPALRLAHLASHERPDALVVLLPRDPRLGGLAPLHDPLNGLVGDPADLSGTSIGAHLTVGGDDVQLFPRRQQWSPLSGERCWLRHRHRHRSGPQLPADTTDARWGPPLATSGDFRWPSVGTFTWPRTGAAGRSRMTVMSNLHRG